MLRSYDAAAGPVEQSIFARQHDDGRLLEYLVVFNQRTGLITIKSRHHDVDKNKVRLMVGDLGEGIETVYCREHLAALLREQRLRRPPDGFTVVHDQYFETVQTPRSII